MVTMQALREEDPSEIGGYPVLARIGAGGMGQVYLGLTRGGRHVALKVIREDFEGPQALARFRREVQTVGRVRSRFAAALVGAGLDAPPYWLATEYVPGPTLRQTVAEHGPLPPDTCLRLFATLSRGLREIHGQGVQHRDLKPGNVILAPDGPRLIDFGIARGEGQTQITRTGAWNGTPGYVAPEVVRDQEPLPASDVFSLAGTIAYAATGRPPFGGGPIEAILHRTLSGEIDVEGADPRVAALVRRCAMKEPGERATLEAVLEETAAEGALAEDPGYRRLVGGVGPLPGSVADAVASGLVPPERTRGRGGRGTIVLAASSVSIVVVAAALIARFAFGGGGEPPDTASATGTRPTGTTSTATIPVGGPPTSSAQGGPPSPDKLFVKQPNADFQATRWTKANAACLPAVRPEDESLARDLQMSAPRDPVAEGGSVELSVRFKFAQRRNYYVTALIRPPVWMQGNTITGEVHAAPVPLPSDGEFAVFRYPADFKWPQDQAYRLDKGAWTVIWLHVHANGDAYYLGCDGFEVA
jgi:hypothetical protein